MNSNLCQKHKAHIYNTFRLMHCKKSIKWLIVLIIGIVLTANIYSQERIYELLDSVPKTFLGIDAGVDAYQEATLYLGGEIIQFIPGNMRLDGELSFHIHDEPHEESFVRFDSRINISLLHRENTYSQRIISRKYSKLYSTSSATKKLIVPLERRRDLNVHGGYYFGFLEHRLSVGLNYSDFMFAKLRFADRDGKTIRSTEYFDVGAELLYLINYLDTGDNDTNRLGGNLYFAGTTSNFWKGVIEVGYLNGLIFKLGAAYVIGL